ncbi:histone-lysine N-methyltransferase, H3 lysine-9 specific SUVH6-like [Mercurialis annua]|uniref:histone-lysine N-methyltransferase, H3 lysine-9 specific SUVH6-like n=1 Tax=Mercurialis annua TaxID=3986 RepID=UPI00215EA710|nr:histone-lysine N-methyltransferase, H3 lysine-9 specific SUVH6-like [Mercurialis annua]XP_050227990.1 histone-lysine N-methyltransferase, H3 lysine-9 specific SUVH6-like [Mercurialis annua]
MGFAENTLHTESVRVNSRRLPMEIDHNTDVNGSLPKYKRRKVSAVRDFPVGCGPSRNIATFEVPVSEPVVALSNPVDVEIIKSPGHETVDVKKDSCNGDVSAPVENVMPQIYPPQYSPSRTVSECETVDVQKDSCNGDVSAPVENVMPQIYPPQYSPSRTVSERETVDVQKNSCNGDVSAPVENVMPQIYPPQYPPRSTVSECETVDVQKDFCNGDVSAPVENVMPQIYPPQYPPRRTVSAVRDFPSFCGRNAVCILESADVLASEERKNSDQEMLGVEGYMSTAAQEMGQGVQNGNADEHEVEGKVSSLSRLNVQANSARTGFKDMRKQDEFGATPENEQGMKSPKESTQHHRGKRSIGDSESIDCLEPVLSSIVVLGLRASGNGPLLKENEAHYSCNLASGTDKNNWKKSDLVLQEQPKASVRIKKNNGENFGGTYKMNTKKELEKLKIKKSSFPSSKAHLEQGEGSDKFQLVRRSHVIDVTLSPSCPSSSSGKGDGNDASVTRRKVMEILRLFQHIYRKLVKEGETQLTHIKRPDCKAAGIIKSEGKYVNTNKIIGSVPGVEIGDEFQYRVELNMIGLHRPTQGGIDFVKEGASILAVSIVASGGYDDDMDDSDVLIYTGQGGNVMVGKKEPEDQKLERGNLALKNSVDAKNPVRVIRGDTKASESSGAKRTYIYDGLYLVDKFWQEMGPHGKLIFKFRLVRIPGQAELSWKVVKKSKIFKVREGLCMDDISKGREKIPICAVNTVDDEKLPLFEYITHVVCPDWCCPDPPKGCGCTNGCSEIAKCSCVAKNGGEIPYNHSGAIVEAKTLVYECGPFCKCPPSCYNRVTQHGIQFQLEVFKTEARGWGVRSLNSIPSGSFICEYVGELLQEAEAEQRTGNDEYLFDIGNNSSDVWDGLSNIKSETHSSSSEVVGEGGFTIDAAKYGNVGRFINHSCSPNLYAQNVLYDHEDKRIPHIMMFAVFNIPPLQELTYHYNYAIDQVFDSDGNIKKKSCYCGSSECTGRMY